MSSAAAGERRTHARVGGSESDSKIHYALVGASILYHSPLPRGPSILLTTEARFARGDRVACSRKAPSCSWRRCFARIYRKSFSQHARPRKSEEAKSMRLYYPLTSETLLLIQEPVLPVELTDGGARGR